MSRLEVRRLSPHTRLFLSAEAHRQLVLVCNARSTSAIQVCLDGQLLNVALQHVLALSTVQYRWMPCEISHRTRGPFTEVLTEVFT